MAHVIAGEAQFCDDAEQKYVGSVVLNRVAHSKYPNTIRGVVFEKKNSIPVWPMAIIIGNQRKVIGQMRNGCLKTGASFRDMLSINRRVNRGIACI